MLNDLDWKLRVLAPEVRPEVVLQTLVAVTTQTRQQRSVVFHVVQTHVSTNTRHKVAQLTLVEVQTCHLSDTKQY